MSGKNEPAILKGNNYDLAVIGAGPAGALAAALAARAGFTTILVESNKQQAKLCGGFVSRRSLSLLPGEINLNHPSFQEIHRLKVLMHNRTYTHCSSLPLGLLVRRDDFDKLLVNYACSKGATFCEGVKLSGIELSQQDGRKIYLLTLTGEEGPKHKIQSRYLLGADGAHGSSARLSGIRKKEGLTGWGVVKVYPYEKDDQEPAALSFYPLPFKGGMGWLFRSHSWTNRGVGGLARPKKLIKTYRALFPGASEDLKLPAWPLPFTGPVKNAADKNILLIGDAAGLVEPYSGEGIFNAFLSAGLAVRALIQAEHYGCSADIFYNDSFKKHFRSKYPATLIGATQLHAMSIVSPSSLPRKIAALMDNKLWFNYKIISDQIFADPFFQ